MALIQGAYRRVEVINFPESIDVAETEIIENLHPNSYILHVEECIRGSSYKFSTLDQDNNSHHRIAFTIGDSFRETFKNGNSAITKSIKRDNKMILLTYFGSRKCQRTFDFAEDSVTMVLQTGSGVKRKIKYERAEYFDIEQYVQDYF